MRAPWNLECAGPTTETTSNLAVLNSTVHSSSLGGHIEGEVGVAEEGGGEAMGAVGDMLGGPHWSW